MIICPAAADERRAGELEPCRRAAGADRRAGGAHGGRARAHGRLQAHLQAARRQHPAGGAFPHC